MSNKKDDYMLLSAIIVIFALCILGWLIYEILVELYG